MKKYACILILLFLASSKLLAAAPTVTMLEVAHLDTLKIHGQRSVIFNMVHSQRVNEVHENRNSDDSAVGCDDDIYNLDCEASFSKILPYITI